MSSQNTTKISPERIMCSCCSCTVIKWRYCSIFLPHPCLIDCSLIIWDSLALHTRGGLCSCCRKVILVSSCCLFRIVKCSLFLFWIWRIVHSLSSASLCTSLLCRHTLWIILVHRCQSYTSLSSSPKSQRKMTHLPLPFQYSRSSKISSKTFYLTCYTHGQFILKENLCCSLFFSHR